MKPDDLFVGVSEFFAILLPGAVLTFAGAYVANRFHVRCDGLHALGLTETSTWWALAIVAYTVGHVIASWGSRLDVLYDEQQAMRGNTKLLVRAEAVLEKFLIDAKAPGERKQAATASKSPLAYVVHLLTADAPKRGPDSESAAGRRRRSTHTSCRAFGSASARRGLFSEAVWLEADSKFFRSLVVVAVLALPAWIALIAQDLVVFHGPT